MAFIWCRPSKCDGGFTEHEALDLRPEILIALVADLVVKEKIIVPQGLRNNVLRFVECTSAGTEQTILHVISNRNKELVEAWNAVFRRFAAPLGYVLLET
jgi:hypothetical protein